jgi:hypothetical protein
MKYIKFNINLFHALKLLSNRRPPSGGTIRFPIGPNRKPIRSI